MLNIYQYLALGLKKNKPLDICNNVLMFQTGRQAMDLINDFFQF